MNGQYVFVNDLVLLDSYSETQELLRALFQNYLAQTNDDDITFEEFTQEVFLEMVA